MTLEVGVKCTLSECLRGKTDSLCIHITSVSATPQGTLVINNEDFTDMKFYTYSLLIFLIYENELNICFK